MLNQVTLIGRIAKLPELRVTETGKKIATVTLAVPRNYKNMNGEYDTDFLDCTLWTNIAENTTEYFQQGDIIAIQGRVENLNKSSSNRIKIVGNKVTFIRSTKHNGEEN